MHLSRASGGALILPSTSIGDWRRWEPPVDGSTVLGGESLDAPGVPSCMPCRRLTEKVLDMALMIQRTRCPP